MYPTFQLPMGYPYSWAAPVVQGRELEMYSSTASIKASIDKNGLRNERDGEMVGEVEGDVDEEDANDLVGATESVGLTEGAVGGAMELEGATEIVGAAATALSCDRFC